MVKMHYVDFYENYRFHWRYNQVENVIKEIRATIYSLDNQVDVRKAAYTKEIVRGR